MTIAEKVRGILAQRPLTKAEVVMILGIKNAQARSCLNELVRSGMVSRDDDVFRLVRERTKRTPMTREKALARHERNRRAKGQRPRAEYLAELAATREERRKAAAERKAAKGRAKREALRALRPPKPAKVPKPRREPMIPRASKSRPANQQPSCYRALPSMPEVPPVRLMSSTEWGGPIERLEPWEVSKPLRITREIVRRMAA